MATRGSSKWFATRAERRVARAYGARHSPSSGASIISKGDSKQAPGTRLELQDQLFESKHTGSFAAPKRSYRIKLEDLEELADVAWAENREPVFHVSIYAPDSGLAGQDGTVDVIIRLMSEDLRREGRVV